MVKIKTWNNIRYMYSKKHRVSKIYRRKSRKLKGGEKKETLHKEAKVDQEELSKEIKNAHTGIVGPATKLIGNVANNIASKAISGASSLLNIDLANKEDINDALEKQVKILSDPKTRENIGEVIGEGAEVLAESLKASQPAINQLFKTTTEAVEKSGTKIGKAAVNIIANTLEEIPMVGILVGTIRSVDKAIEAAQSIVNAGSEIVVASGDAVNQVTQNITEVTKNLNKKVPILEIPTSINDVQNKLKVQDAIKDAKGKMKEKMDLLKKVGGSISYFHDSTLNPGKFIKTAGTRKIRKH